MKSDSKKNGAGVERRAVIDIGSNSVRLVIYDGPKRAPFSICNEKALCGLGRDMTDDGKLNPEAANFAFATLRRFARILKEHNNPPVHAIATAAVRDAKDGEQFVQAVKEIGFEVDVLTGEQEAVFAAMGVVSFEPGAAGIVGDMGGGSLELVTLDKGKIKESTSLQVGPLNIMRRAPGGLKQATAIIEEELDKAELLKTQKCDALYAVGGAWRAVARIHMRLKSYPLSVLHHYELTSTQTMEVCDLVSKQSRRSLEQIPGIPRRRLDTLPYAALVLKSVLKRTKAKKVVVSAGGVREGILHQALSKGARETDPLLAACRFYAERLAPDPVFGDAAFEMVEPLFAENEDVAQRIRYATCLLIDIGAYFHPDQRGRHVFDAALHAPFVAVSHDDRVWTALALYCRHEGRSAALPDEQAIGLLSWDQQMSATQFGLAMRFAASLSPKSPAPLKDCRLEWEPGRLTFRAPSDREDLMGETPRRRLDSLAASFEADAIEIYEG